MGACYSVTLKIKLLDEENAIIALNNYMQNDQRTDYSLSKYAAQGITTGNFDDLMRIFLAGWKNQEINIEIVNDFTTYSNDFDASYGWEDVLIKMFEILAPFIADGSELLIYLDNDYDKLIIQNRKCVQVH